MDKTDEILSRRVEKILPDKEGLKKLMSERRIRLYQGFDATGGRLHLGHSVGIRKLMDFADEGHEVIFLFGTGTVLVGDPSQRDSGRKLITAKEVEENIQGWKAQVSPLVDWDKIKILKNGEWLTKLTLPDIIGIASNISAVQLFKREMFQKRLERGDTVWYHETMYPLLQGFDSVEMDVDLEIGGTDQEFNMLIGRELMKKMKNKEKFVLTTPMILGTDGKQMSKTSDNCIWLNDLPSDMYAKIMALVDSQIISYMRLVTDLPEERINEIETGLKEEKIHPLEAKKELADAVVTQLHSREKAHEAKAYFEKTFQEKKPDFTTEIPIKDNIAATIAPFTAENSISSAKRLILQGGVDVNDTTVTDPTFKPNAGDRIKIGQKTFGVAVEYD